MMNLRKYLAAVGLVGFFLICFGLFSPAKTQALSSSDWQAGRIIDDSVFVNTLTMSTQDIQNFLNSKVPSCDTNGTKEYGSTGLTRAQWAAQNGEPAPPYTCLKDYAQVVPATPGDAYCGTIGGASMSAATIIKTVSAACGINPEVLIVTIQKEQALITDDWPWPYEYQEATGYGCPDSATSCDSDYYGFFNQVYNAAHQFQRYAKQPGLFNYTYGQTGYVSYSTDSSCGGGNIYMQSQATADLYNYTPYQPNGAALSGLNDSTPGGTATCGSYGNRNFWWYYWEWFGNPTGPNYAWSVDSFSFNNNMGQSTAQTVTLKAKNIGRFPWYAHGATSNPMRLATWQPGRGSPFNDATWLDPATPAEMSESVVQPGEDGTFTFQLHSPNTPGATYVEPFNLVMENYQWLPWAGFSPTINVTNQYAWQVQSVVYGNGTGVMEPGSQQLITVIARNTGSATWSKSSGPDIRLGTWLPERQSSVAYNWISSIRAARMNENSVAPGQTAGFQFNVNMPTVGNYYERMNLVAEGQAWFNDPGLTLYLHGQTYAWQPISYSISTGTAAMQRGQSFSVTLKVKNTGESTWHRDGPWPVRLGTWSPGSSSSIYDSSWISSIRTAGLQEANIAPGQTGTFVFNAKMPSTPGESNQYFNLVAEGLTWFNNPGFYIYLHSL